MVYQNGGGFLQAAAFAPDAFILDIAEGLEDFLKLAREPLALDAETGQEAMGVDDVELDAS